jgi:CheY-like chemotaxis protein
MKALPLVYYPTAVNWVDDDILFLKTISQAVKSERPPQTYLTPTECLLRLQYQTPVLANLPLFKSYVNHDEYGMNHHIPLDADLLAVSSLRNNADRFNDISVVVVDYHMPGMTGIELCRELQGQPVKKILLTGAADQQQLAIEAFNEKIIDCFLHKDNPNLVSELQSFVCLLSQEYFRDLTQPLLAHLEVENKLPLTDPIFIQFFHEWCRTNKILEYYLIDKNGSYLAIDEVGKTRYLIVHTDKTLDAFTELHDAAEVASLLDDVIKRQKIPFFGVAKEAWEFDTKDWPEHFYTSLMLDGKERYYYSSQYE